MAEKSFGVKEVNLIGASGTPSITSPNNLNLNAVNVAISTNVSIGGTLTVSGNVSVGGTLTYEDVTNIDSVGLITARNGLIVTGVTTSSEGLFIPEDKELKLGNTSASPDFKIYNDSSSSYVHSTQAGAYLRVVSAGGLVMQQGTSQNCFFAAQSGKTSLYYAGNSKIETTNTGVTVTGTVVATTFSGSGASLTGIAVTEAPVTDYTITANGSSAYRFHGGGVDETADDPDLYLVRGQKYRFNNTTGSSHPFAIREASGGSAYSNGVTGSNQGVQFFTVPYDAPAKIFYQCTIHSGMVGNIYIRGASGQNDNVGITTITGGLLHISSGTNGDAKLIIEADTDNNLEADNPTLVFKQDGGIEVSSIGHGLLSGDQNGFVIANSVTNGYISFATGTTNGHTNATERLHIAGSDGKLTHTQTGGEAIDFGTTGGSGAYHKYDLSASGATTGYIGAGNQLVTGGGVADFAFRSQANMLFSTGGATERLRIDTNGKVGIGTNNPATKLHIFDSSADPYLKIGGGGRDCGIQLDAATNFTAFRTDAANRLYVNAGGDSIRFSIGGTSSEKVRIDSNGKVSIASGAYGGGGSVPELYVKGTSGRQMKIHNSNASTSSLQITNATTGEGEDAGTQLFTQGSTGDFFIYNAYATGDVAFGTRPSGGSTTERVRITSAGKIGVNATTTALIAPGYTLDLGGNDGSLDTSEQNTIRIRCNNGGTAIRVGPGGGGSRVTLIRADGESSGNLCFGETDKSAYGVSLVYHGDRSGNENSFAVYMDQTTNANQIEAFNIRQNGDYMFGGSSYSDRDQKENITAISGTALDKITQLSPKTWNWKPEYHDIPTDRIFAGFIAQEVQPHIPSIVTGTDGQGDMALDYQGLLAWTIKALTELKSENDNLKARVNTLEGS